MHTKDVRSVSLCPLLIAAAVAVGCAPVLAISTDPNNPISLYQKTLASVSGGVEMAYSPDSPANRLFIVGQISGDITLLKGGIASTFLDLNAAKPAGGGVTLSTSGSNEKGFLGLAFSPEFATPGTPGYRKVYTFTSEPKSASAATPDFINPELIGGNAGDCDSVIREWTVSAANPDVVDTSLGSREILRLRKPQSNHNGGTIRFGPDGYLYVSLGDGGSGNDYSGSIGSTTDGHSNPGGNGQAITDTYTDAAGSHTVTNVLGKLLRIDPRDPSTTPGSADPVSTNGKYRVPASNPFSTGGVKNEIYAYGLRNPFRFSFDRSGATLYIADVGQGSREEIDIGAPGANYGWPYREGKANTSPRTIPAGFTSTDPIVDYTHTDGTSAIGGFVYRGSNFPELYGKYVFGDYAKTSQTNGRLYYMDPALGATIYEFVYANPGSAPSKLLTIGEGSDGELYALWADSTVRKLLGRQWNGPGGGSWGAAGNWLGAIPSAASDDARFLSEVAGNATVTLDGNRTVGALLFNGPGSYTIAAGTGGTLTVDRLTTTAAINVVGGSHTISAPLVLGGGTRLSIAANASLKLSGFLTGKAAVPMIDPAGTLDLTFNDFIVDYAGDSPFNMLQSRIISGFHNGDWQGAGITTSTATANIGLAYAEASRLLNLSAGDTTTFNAQSIDATTFLIKYTWYGDLNFDGKVNADDYTLMDASFAKGVAPGTAQWLDGDFNYDGSLTPADYLRIDAAFVQQSGTLSPDLLALRESQFGPAYVSDLLASVPEPGMTAAIVIGLSISLVSRRNRRQSDAAQTNI